MTTPDQPVASPTQPEAEPGNLRAAAYSGLISAAAVMVSLLASGVFNARSLGPTDRGYFQLITLALTVLCQIGAFSSAIALTHFLASRQISAATALRVFRRPFLFQVGVVSVAMLVVGQLLAAGHDAEVHWTAVIAVAGVVTAFSRDYGLAFVVGCGHNAKGNYLRVAPAAFWAAGIGAVYVAAPGSLLAAIAVFVCVDALASGLIWFHARRAIRASRAAAADDAVELEEILHYGRRGFFAFLSPLENFNLDQFVVSLAFSPTSLGYYAAGGAFNSVPRVLATNLGMAASPVVSAAESRGLSKRAAGMVFIWLTVGVTGLATAVLIALIPWMIPALFGEPFRPAIPLCQVLLLAGPLMAMRRIVVDVLRGAGRPAGARGELLALAAFAVAAPLLGSAYGAIGIAWALVIATALNLALLLATQLRGR